MMDQEEFNEMKKYRESIVIKEVLEDKPKLFEYLRFEENVILGLRERVKMMKDKSANTMIYSISYSTRKVYETALEKYPKDFSLWQKYVRFHDLSMDEEADTFTFLQSVFLRCPSNTAFWLLAATMEENSIHDVHHAFTTILLHSDERSMFLDTLRMELMLINHMLESEGGKNCKAAAGKGGKNCKAAAGEGQETKTGIPELAFVQKFPNFPLFLKSIVVDASNNVLKVEEAIKCIAYICRIVCNYDGPRIVFKRNDIDGEATDSPDESAAVQDLIDARKMKRPVDELRCLDTEDPMETWFNNIEFASNSHKKRSALKDVTNARKMKRLVGERHLFDPKRNPVKICGNTNEFASDSSDEAASPEDVTNVRKMRRVDSERSCSESKNDPMETWDNTTESESYSSDEAASVDGAFDARKMRRVVDEPRFFQSINYPVEICGNTNEFASDSSDEAASDEDVPYARKMRRGDSERSCSESKNDPMETRDNTIEFESDSSFLNVMNARKMRRVVVEPRVFETKNNLVELWNNTIEFAHESYDELQEQFNMRKVRPDDVPSVFKPQIDCEETRELCRNKEYDYILDTYIDISESYPKPNDLELSKSVAEHIYEIGNTKFKEIPFIIDMFTIAKRYSFTENLQIIMLRDLRHYFFSDEHMWSIIAQRALSGSPFVEHHFISKPLEKESFLDPEDCEEPEIPEILMTPMQIKRVRLICCCRMFKLALEKVRTADLHNLYLSFLLDVEKDRSHLRTLKKQLMLEGMEMGHKKGYLQAKHYFKWITLLPKDRVMIEKVLRSATDRYQRNEVFWQMRLKFHLSEQEEDKSMAVLNQAAQIFGNDHPRTHILWNMLVQYWKNKDVMKALDICMLAHRNTEKYTLQFKEKCNDIMKTIIGDAF